MSLTAALSSALSGLRANQASLEVTAGNIANAGTAGYTRKVLGLTTAAAGNRTIGVTAGQIQRQLDLQVQAQARTQASHAGFADLRASFAARLDLLFGSPGGATSLDTLYAAFGASLEALVATPDSLSGRTAVIGAARVLADQLNAFSGTVQSMRQEAEAGIAEAAAAANGALAEVARLNQQIRSQTASGSPPAPLLDQRDLAVAKLAELMDIRVSSVPDGTISIATASGITLLDGGFTGELRFDARSGIKAESAWSSDPAQRGVGTLTLIGAGSPIDLFAANAVQSGAIAAYRDLRDQMLPEAQAQLDALAHQLATVLGNETVTGSTAATVGGDGFELDLAGMLPGNTVTLDYVETPAGTPRRVTFVRVDDPAALPLGNDATADPTDTVHGIDFSAGMAGIVAQMQAALGGGLAVSSPGGTTLRILDDGAGASTDVAGLSASVTATGTADGSPALPLFTDGASPYSGSFDGGRQIGGFAARIRVNPSLAGNPAGLVVYETGVAAGDATRPAALLDRLNASGYLFPTGGGIGTAVSPFGGSIGDYVSQILGNRGAAAESAQVRADSATLALNSLQERLERASGVSIDEEMAHLVELQSAYAANARVITVVKEMLDLLLSA